ncbi:MAG: TonB-dependent receptor [Pseudomonadota bacterium]
MMNFAPSRGATARPRAVSPAWLVSLAVLTLGVSAAAQSQRIPEITVFDRAQGDDRYDVTDAVAFSGADPTFLLRQVPGATANNNGPLSMQAQYRGMFGPRVNVAIDGLGIVSGGPNWMDPPLHYLPSGLVDSLVVQRGIAPVDAGTSIGGSVEARTVTSTFTESADFRLQGRFGAGGATANESTDLSGFIAAGNNRHRLHVLGAMEDANDARSGRGDLAATSYERDTVGIGYGLRLNDDDFIAIDYLRTDTGNSGNPVLPLDIEFFETDRFTLSVEFSPGAVTLQARVRVIDVDHRMNNFELRNPPDFSQLTLPPFQDEDRRFVAATASGVNWRLAALMDAAGGTLTIGTDGGLEEHDAQVGDPDVPPFFVTNFNNARSDTVAVFAQWQGLVAPRVGIEAGVRYANVSMEAGEVDAQPAQLVDAGMFGPGTPPFAVFTLRNRFNEGSRSATDNNVDVVFKADYEVSADLSIGWGLARKVRSPSYIERFLWIPLEINSGLGDLNNYVGDVDLSPEVSYEAEFGLAWQSERAYASPRVFVRRVDDFIQGVATTDMPVVAVSGNANGDPTPLQFANVDAEFYGADMAFGMRLAQHWRIDGNLSYVRGERRDIADDLFRIMPLNGHLRLAWERSAWSLGLDMTAAATQERISEVIVGNEPRSDNDAVPGYAVFGLSGRWQGRSGITVMGGVDNLLDHFYASAASGFNRVGGGAATVGNRLPALGRNGWLRVQWAFGDR